MRSDPDATMGRIHTHANRATGASGRAGQRDVAAVPRRDAVGINSGRPVIVIRDVNVNIVTIANPRLAETNAVNYNDLFRSRVATGKV